MATFEAKTFDSPDEQRTPPKAKIDFVRFGDNTVARVTYYPGWR